MIEKLFGNQIGFAVDALKELFLGTLARTFRKGRREKGLTWQAMIDEIIDIDPDISIDVNTLREIEMGHKRKLSKGEADVLSKVLGVKLQ